MKIEYNNSTCSKDGRGLGAGDGNWNCTKLEFYNNGRGYGNGDGFRFGDGNGYGDGWGGGNGDGGGFGDGSGDGN